MKGKRVLRNIAVMVAALLCASATPLYAQWYAVDWASEFTGLTLSDKTTGLPRGDLVAIGHFGTMTDTQIEAITSATDLWNAFTVFATGSIGDGEDSTAIGTFAEASSRFGGAGFFSMNAYLIAFNAGTYTTATQYGCFRGSAETWVFPRDDAAPAQIIDTASCTGLVNVLIGDFGTGTFYSPYQDEWLNALALIPEPSTCALVGVGLLGILGMMRRKSAL